MATPCTAVFLHAPCSMRTYRSLALVPATARYGVALVPVCRSQGFAASQTCQVQVCMQQSLPGGSRQMTGQPPTARSPGMPMQPNRIAPAPRRSLRRSACDLSRASGQRQQEGMTWLHSQARDLPSSLCEHGCLPRACSISSGGMRSSMSFEDVDAMAACFAAGAAVVLPGPPPLLVELGFPSCRSDLQNTFSTAAAEQGKLL